MLQALLSKCPALPTQGLSHHTPPHPTPILLLFTQSGAPTPNRILMLRSERWCRLKYYKCLPEVGIVITNKTKTKLVQFHKLSTALKRIELCWTSCIKLFLLSFFPLHFCVIF